MSKRIRVGMDIFGVVVLLAGLGVALALVTYQPADSPTSREWPPRHVPTNLFGEPGSSLARQVLDFFGAAAAAALGAWFVLGLTILLDGRQGIWCWRLAGWLLLVPAVALVAQLWVPGGWIVEAVVGPGGVLGAALLAALGDQLTHQGLVLVAVALLVGGVGLAGDFFWPGFFRTLGRGLRFAWRGWLAHCRRKGRLRGGTRDGTLHRIPIRPLGAAVLPPLAADEDETAASPRAESRKQTTAFVPPVRHPAPLPREIPPNDYHLPPFDLLSDPDPFPYEEHDQLLRERAVKLERTFADFDLNVRVVGINTGPVITQYEVALETGLRVNKVTALADDLALNLKVPSVRIVAPIPGKDTVGIEIPNEHRAVVRLKELILNAGNKVAQQKIPLFLGKDTEGRPLVYDLADMPHLLIAGRTGTGKSVCMNAIILSMLMTRRPDEVRMVMIDPKMLELSEYGKIPHLMHPVVKDMKKAEAILAWAVDKMEERYDILSRARVRNVASYNELGAEEIYRRLNPESDDERARIPEKMPYIVIFVDEVGDLMMTLKKEVEGHIIRLAQKSRAAGIHLIMATQKPTVDVITGLIKSNLPARICFQVSSRSDSRVVLDEMGAERLLGRGDMLFLQPGTSTLIRAQGSYASDAEISRVVKHLECEPMFSTELLQLSTAAKSGKGADEQRPRDELYEQAVEIVIREQRGSVSLLQRSLGIGYGRSARLIDWMAEDGIVAGYNGSNARDVLIKPEEWAELRKQREAACS